MQSIEAALASVTFPEPEKPVVEPQVETILVVEPTAEGEPLAVETAPVVEGAVPAVEETASAPVPAEEVKEEEEKDFDKLFSMQSVLATPPVAEEESEEERNKKKEKKAKKGRELEFDEKRGEVVARKKHKLGDTDSGLEEWE
jgi:hypothetical protein